MSYLAQIVMNPKSQRKLDKNMMTVNHFWFLLSPVINDPLTGPGGTHPCVRHGTSVYGPKYAMPGSCLLGVKDQRSV